MCIDQIHLCYIDLKDQSHIYNCQSLKNQSLNSAMAFALHLNICLTYLRPHPLDPHVLQLTYWKNSGDEEYLQMLVDSLPVEGLLKLPSLSLYNPEAPALTMNQHSIIFARRSCEEASTEASVDWTAGGMPVMFMHMLARMYSAERKQCIQQQSARAD